MVNHAKSSRLEKFEIPGAVTLTHIEWTPVRLLSTQICSDALNIILRVFFSGHGTHHSCHEAEKKTTAGVLQGGFGQNVRPLTTYELLLNICDHIDNHCDHIDHHSNAFDLAKCAIILSG